MNNETLISIYSASLEFYSSRAESHASFFLATFFGLFTIFSIIHSSEIIRNRHDLWWLWHVPVVGLIFMALYSFGNFCLYASYANRFLTELEVLGNIKIEYMLKELRERHLYLKFFYNVKQYPFFHNFRFELLTLGFIIMIICSYYIIFRPSRTHLGWIIENIKVLLRKLDC